jgi:hypothetical protein
MTGALPFLPLLVQGSKWTVANLPPCTRNNAHINTSCCHITHHNEIFIILISDFSQELYVFPMMICDVLSKHVGAVKVF